MTGIGDTSSSVICGRNWEVLTCRMLQKQGPGKSCVPSRDAKGWLSPAALPGPWQGRQVQAGVLPPPGNTRIRKLFLKPFPALQGKALPHLVTVCCGHKDRESPAAVLPCQACLGLIPRRDLDPHPRQVLSVTWSQIALVHGDKTLKCWVLPQSTAACSYRGWRKRPASNRTARHTRVAQGVTDEPKNPFSRWTEKEQRL